MTVRALLILALLFAPLVLASGHEVFTKFANPSPLPGNTTRDVAWTQDEQYLAVATWSTSPYLSWYKVENGAATRLPNPTQPSFSVKTVAWDPTGTYLAAGREASSDVLVYKRSGDTLTQLSNAPLANGVITGMAWDPTGTYLATSNEGSVRITIYQRSGDTFTRLANPAVLPTGQGNAVSWSSQDILAIGHDITPFITAYTRSGNTFTKIANPASLPTSMITDVNWSTDGSTFLAVQNNGAKWYTYTWDGSALTRHALAPAGDAVFRVGFSPDDNYIAVGRMPNATTSFHVYRWDGTTATLIPNAFPSPATSTSDAVAWSPGGNYVAFGSANSPYLHIYNSNVGQPPPPPPWNDCDKLFGENGCIYGPGKQELAEHAGISTTALDLFLGSIFVILLAALGWSNFGTIGGGVGAAGGFVAGLAFGFFPYWLLLFALVIAAATFILLNRRRE